MKGGVTGKRLGINKQVLVYATTVRTRLTMSFPDPLNPRTYFYKAVLAACAPDCGSAHINLYFSSCGLRACPTSLSSFLSPLPHRSQIKSLVEPKHELASALHPSPSIFPVTCTPPPQDFFPRQFLRDAHGRAAPRLMPASPRSDRVLQVVDALSCSSSPQ